MYLLTVVSFAFPMLAAKYPSDQRVRSLQKWHFRTGPYFLHACTVDSCLRTLTTWLTDTDGLSETSMWTWSPSELTDMMSKSYLDDISSNFWTMSSFNVPKRIFLLYLTTNMRCTCIRYLHEVVLLKFLDVWSLLAACLMPYIVRTIYVEHRTQLEFGVNRGMHMMGLTVRLYPDEGQEVLMNKTFGCCRQIYNLHLNERNEYWNEYSEVPREKRPRLVPTTERQWKEMYPYMREVSAVALQQARMDCDRAFDNWFKSSKGMIGGNFRHPKFKSKKSNRFSYREVMLSDGCFDFDHRTLTLPKLGKVRFRLRELPAQFDPKAIRNVTVRKSPSGKYFASLCCEAKYSEPTYRHESQVSAVGLDWSPKDMFVADDGRTGRDFGYVAFRQESARRLAVLRRRLAKKAAGGKNREKARVRVARLEEHVENQRRELHERIARELVRRYAVVGVEDLDLRGISMFLRNARNVGDTGWGSFVQVLERQAARHNSVVVRADRFYPSSKTCSSCGAVKTDLNLSEREWTCPSCGTRHVRDVNAAVNLRENALRTLGSRGSEACGDCRPCPTKVGQAESVKQECATARSRGNGSHLQ